MSKIYAKPAIVEVVCELRFTAESPWDADLPLAFFERVKDRFPRFAPQARLDLRVETVASAARGGTALVQADPLMVFSRDDGQALVQLGRHLLALNQFQPYPSWSALQPLIGQVVDAYLAVGRPAGIERIGLRYINQIALPAGTSELSAFFTLYPRIGPTLPQAFAEAQLRMVYAFAEERDAMAVTLATLPPGQEHGPTIVLDLDYSLVLPGAVALDGLSEWIDQAHGQIEAVFEACLTDQTRELLEERDA